MLELKRGVVMSLTYVTDQTFDIEVLSAKGLVLVDFWAPWCGPCKMIAPILEELNSEIGNDVKIVKMNVDEELETPTQFGIRSIPTLILFKNGNKVDSRSGMAPKSALLDWVKSHL